MGKVLTAEEQKAKKNVVHDQVVASHQARPGNVEISKDGNAAGSKARGAENVSTEAVK